MDWFSRFTGETRGRLVELLRRSERTIPALAEMLGISDTAVRNHIAALQRDGLVETTEVERATGGKPARLYGLSPEAEELFPKAYAYVLGELVGMLEERDGREAAVALLRELGRRAAASADAEGRTVATRVAVAASALRDLGGSVAVEREEGGWCIRGDGCPLSAVVRDHAEVCTLAASLVEEIIGGPVTGACERGARPKCVFRVAGEAGRADGAEEA